MERASGLYGPALGCPSSIHALYFSVCRCECVIVDVGLNDGKSLLTWPVHLLNRFKKLNRSSQASVRHRLHTCVERNATTCFYGFEANPAFDLKLLTLESQLRGQGIRARLFRSMAFSTGSEGADFLVEPFEYRTGAVSSTMESNNVLAYQNEMGHWKTNFTTSVSDHYKRVRVNSMDAGQFLAAVVKDSDFVGVKLDVEGFEYRLLPQLLLTVPRVLCAIELLAIEWHEHIARQYRGGRDHIRWLMRRPECSASLIEWH